MANRNQTAPYLELGNFLKQYRQKKFRSALELFRNVQFSFSYSLYADFEKGVAIPSVAVILELARYFGTDENAAVMLWARVQMPTESLKKVFTYTPNKVIKNQEKAIIETPGFENTWVLGPSELKLLSKTPWLWDLCLLLVQSYPHELEFTKLCLPKGVSQKTLLKKYLSNWLQSGYLEVSKTGLILKYQHIYLPKTQEWDEIRKANIKRATDNLLQSITVKDLAEKRGCRELIQRELNSEQVEYLVEKLKNISAEFESIPYSKTKASQNQMHALILILGKRQTLTK